MKRNEERKVRQLDTSKLILQENFRNKNKKLIYFSQAIKVMMI